MRIEELKTTNGTAENPCELVGDFMLWEQNGGTLQTWLERFDFDERSEIERAIRLFIRSVSLDGYMRRKKLAEENPFAAVYGGKNPNGGLARDRDKSGAGLTP